MSKLDPTPRIASTTTTFFLQMLGFFAVLGLVWAYQTSEAERADRAETEMAECLARSTAHSPIERRQAAWDCHGDAFPEPLPVLVLTRGAPLSFGRVVDRSLPLRLASGTPDRVAWRRLTWPTFPLRMPQERRTDRERSGGG